MFAHNTVTTSYCLVTTTVVQYIQLQTRVRKQLKLQSTFINIL
jgi:hypothetical protein